MSGCRVEETSLGGGFICVECGEDCECVVCKITETEPVPYTLTELGKILLREAGEQSCREGYLTTDPYWVGRYAIGYGDINPDGTLN